MRLRRRKNSAQGVQQFGRETQFHRIRGGSVCCTVPQLSPMHPQQGYLQRHRITDAMAEACRVRVTRAIKLLLSPIVGTSSFGLRPIAACL